MPRSTTTNDSQTAEALRATLISPNVSDSNWEPANVVDVLHDLGNAVEKHGGRVATGLESVASAIRDLAEAIRERGHPS
jgi:hypothetical protein